MSSDSESEDEFKDLNAFDSLHEEELTDGARALMKQRLSLLRDAFVRKNGVGLKLPSASDRLKRGRGKLKRFIDMPLDVFLEIASSIEPLDLIHLSRLNKEFHATFMSQSARFVWTRVLESVPGLPGCPPDMTEPQYASLIFEQQCSACNSVRASKVYFTLRVRFCSACSGGNVRRGRYISPYPAWSFRESIWCLLPAHQSHCSNNEWNYYLVSEIDLVIEECLAFKDDNPARQKYMSDREAMTVAIMRHGVAVNRWYAKRQRDAVERKDELIKRRLDAIYDRLEGLGCQRRYFPISRYAKDPTPICWRHPMDNDTRTWFNLVEQPKELTDRSWKTLRPKLEKLYTNLKRANGKGVLRIYN